MKFCPYCGANLFDENVLFCSNCGKKLPPHEAGITEPLTEEMRPEPEKTPKVEPSTKKKGRKKKASNKKATRVVDEPPVDDGYDGYYDDVQPPDLDRVKEGLDKELIKKIVALNEAYATYMGQPYETPEQYAKRVAQEIEDDLTGKGYGDY